MVALNSNPTHPLENLTDEDYEELRASGLTDEQIVQTGHFSISDKAEAKNLTGINHRGLVFRYLDPHSGKPYQTSNGKLFYRMKPRDWADSWTDPDETPPKYLSAKDSGCKPYFSPLLVRFSHRAKSPHKYDLTIVEGEKKADLLAANSYFVIGLGGVDAWRDSTARSGEVDIPPAQLIEDDEEAQFQIEGKLPESRLLPELTEALEWQYRRVNICFDSDIMTKPSVKRAASKLAGVVADLQAKPFLIRLPNELDGTKNGPDDFIVRHGIEAYRLLEKIAQPALKRLKVGGFSLNWKTDPKPLHKILIAWTVLKETWRYRPGIGWYRWEKDHWVLRPDQEMEKDVIRFQDAQGWEQTSGHEVVCRQLRCRLLVSNEDWNPASLMAFKNGTLDCSTGEFKQGHQRENFLTSVLPYDYNDVAQCPTWINFLNEALQGDQEAIDLLQAFIKWVLLPKSKDKKAEIEKSLDLIGTKGTGKGTFLDALIALVGAENVGAIGTETFKSPAYLSGLLDKKLSVDTDAFGYLANVGLFNQVVSNEPVVVKALYKDPITTRLGTVIVRAYNRVLEVPDGSEGLDRRIIAISFNHQPAEIDLELSEKIQAELPGIFAWAWRLPQPEMKRRLIWAGAVKSVQEASIKRFEANNPEYVFLAETFPEGNNRVKASDLYNSYVEWSKNTGVSPKKLRKFSEAIQGMGCQRSTKTDGCFFYSIPPMSQFDPIGYLGLKKKIKNSIPEVLPPQSSLLSLSQSQQALGVRDDCFSIVPESSTIPELSAERDNHGTIAALTNKALAATELRLECDNKFSEESKNNRPLEISTLDSREDTTLRDDSGRIEKQSSLASNPLSERDRDSRDDLGHKTPGINLEFPYLGCEVNKIVDGIRRPYLTGYIREINGDAVKVWWHMDWQLNRNGKPIKDKGEELAREKWTPCRLDELCPRPLLEAREMKRCKHIEARNQTFIDQAIRVQRAKNSQSSESGSQESEVPQQAVQTVLTPTRPAPYHPRTNPPKKGDRIRSTTGKAGQIIQVRATNPKYIIRWEDDREMHYDFQDLQILDIRRED